LGAEFSEVLHIIKNEKPEASVILDLAAGNGIASYAFTKAGFKVTALEPDASETVGRGAINFIKTKEGLNNLDVFDGYGESMPFNDDSFEVVYLRQALHHAADLEGMLKEIFRVLKRGGLLLATREHVVDNYNEGLKEFLDSQADHQLYGGEYAYTLDDYKSAIVSQGFTIRKIFKPYESPVNIHPGNLSELHASILKSRKGKLIKLILGRKVALNAVLFLANRRKIQGRIYSFIAKK
jgi:ubiquinone/menaquinone biosynthesis C-methylase UbiE